jgi:hypothetical protein
LSRKIPPLGLDRDPLPSVAPKVPARRIAHVRKQGVHARLLFGFKKIKLRFAALLLHVIVGPNGDHSVRVAATGNGNAHCGIIARIKKGEDRYPD